MDQPFVIVQVADHNQYLSSNFPRSWEAAQVATWVPCGAWRDEVFAIQSLQEAKAFAAEFHKKTGIPVEVVTKWTESIDEIMAIVGGKAAHAHNPSHLRDAIGRLWHALPAYPSEPGRLGG